MKNEMTHELRIRNGRFYRGGVEERMEIGNAEQIKLLKWTNELISELAGDGIMPRFYEEGGRGFEFPCPCGNQVRGNKGDPIECPHCYRKFKLAKWTDPDFGYQLEVIKSK